MAQFEPFFFYTQGGGVNYLALQLASYDEYSGQTFMAIGAFQNINPLPDDKKVYYLDGRYHDQMNMDSIYGPVPVSETMVYTKANMKKFMKSQQITGIDADNVTLFSFDNFYWFVQNGILPKSRRSASKSRKRSVSRKSRTKSRSPNK